MAIQPQTFLNFTAHHYPLLHDLYRREHGVNEAELYELIHKYRSDNDSQPAHIYNQLLDLRIIEALPDATAIYEITRPIAVLFRFLLQEQRLTSTTVIQAYLDDLDTFYGDLENALREEKHGRIERSLSEIVDTMERIRQDSRANRQAIINEAMAVKGNRERRTVRERFETILLIWEKYLEPLKDLIDVKKSMDGSLDSLESLLKSGLKQYTMDGVVFDELQKTVARLVRLRRDVVSDFHESMQEVEPLYHSLERDSILARGASRALEQIDKFGLRSLQLTDALALPAGWLQQGLFTDTIVESYLHGVKEYVPQQAPHLSLGENVSNPQYMDLQDVVDSLNNEVPVTDTLAWLFDRYLDFELIDILRVYGHLIHSPLFATKFSHEQKNYQFNDVNICAYPMVIEQIL
jgi:hypothetical protein